MIVVLRNVLAVVMDITMVVIAIVDEEGFERQFYTREEKIEMLEEYLTDLKAEQKGVEEALEELRKV